MGKTASRGREQCWRTCVNMVHVDIYVNIVYPGMQRWIRYTLLQRSKELRGECSMRMTSRIMVKDCRFSAKVIDLIMQINLYFFNKNSLELFFMTYKLLSWLILQRSQSWSYLMTYYLFKYRILVFWGSYCKCLRFLLQRHGKNTSVIYNNWEHPHDDPCIGKIVSHLFLDLFSCSFLMFVFIIVHVKFIVVKFT